jgi:hypothetical protein
LKTPPELNAVYGKIRVPDHYQTSDFFPLPDIYQGRMLHDGIATIVDEPLGFFTELSVFGLYFYAQHISQERQVSMGHSQVMIRATEIFCRIDEFIDSAAKYFDQIGYRGSLHYQVYLQNHDYRPMLTFGDTIYGEQRLERSPDAEITYQTTIPAGTLVADRAKWILEPIQRICWGFNYNVTQQDLDRYYSKVKPKA